MDPEDRKYNGTARSAPNINHERDTKTKLKKEGGEGRKHTCIDSNGIIPTRGAHDGARYGRARERTEREDREEHAYAAPNIPRVAERNEGHADEAHERAGRRAVEERERDERAGAVRVGPEEGHYACEEDRGRHDVERAWSRCRADQLLRRDQTRGGGEDSPTRSARMPLDSRPMAEPALAIATR
jgi:hypothetical protein